MILSSALLLILCARQSTALERFGVDPSGVVTALKTPAGFDPDRMAFNLSSYSFVLVSDLDQASRDPQKFEWHSIVKRGELVRTGDSFELQWIGQKRITASTARGNRSMELSEVVRYRHLLLAMCDYTGLIFKILPDGRVFQRWAIADGNGEEPKPFKMEWATVKDGLLWVGSTGKEWTNQEGVVLHHNPEWVKTIDANGRIENHNWRLVYHALRTATGTSPPGYLWHEAVHWDGSRRQWIIVPRKASTGPYDPKTDELNGSNIMFVCSEDFSSIEVKRVGPLEPEYGFSSVRRIPGSDGLYVGIKVREIGAETHSKLVVFDHNGFLRSPWFSAGNVKFEGLDFVHDMQSWTEMRWSSVA